MLAVDAEQQAVDRLEERLSPIPGARDRLTTRVGRIEDVTWPMADLVNASFSLPFCPPPAFPSAWRRIESSLVCGGWFCGQLFGERDGWATSGGSPPDHKGEITFPHTGRGRGAAAGVRRRALRRARRGRPDGGRRS